MVEYLIEAIWSPYTAVIIYFFAIGSIVISEFYKYENV